MPDNTGKQFVHLPVLAEAAVDSLACASGKIVVDATIGGGGHAALILRRIGEGGILIGIDRDKSALDRVRERFGSAKNIFLVHENFSRIAQILDELRVPHVDGLLFDLGLSSFQVDDPARGFSFRMDGPLDMRMDVRQPLTAADIVNTFSEKEIADILKQFGEERNARRIARAIVRERAKAAIKTTGKLAGIVRNTIPRGLGPSRIDPATRTFQALRIRVNSELENLAKALNDGIGRLKPKGRVAVISFHSLEDRIVKRTFSELARGCTCPPEIPKCICGKKPSLKVLTSKPIEPSSEELALNPRSRSARLRAAEKLAGKSE